MGRLLSVVANYGICPIVFNVYEGLKKELRPGALADRTAGGAKKRKPTPENRLFFQ